MQFIHRGLVQRKPSFGSKKEAENEPWLEKGNCFCLTPMVEQAKMVLQRYHSGEVDAILDEGLSYTGGWHNLTVAFEILKQAIEEVGAENFDGQAFY
jgi:hypothetical protein